MAPRESEPQKETVERVMHEFKHGELRSGTSGKKVRNRKQAVAIALSEAGASNQQTPKENESICATPRRRSVGARRRRMKLRERPPAGDPPNRRRYPSSSSGSLAPTA